jgi:hypothetical protein
MNRELLKKAIKKLVLQEIANNQFGTPDHKEDTEATKAAEKIAGKDGKVINSPGTGKVVADKAKHSVAFSKQSDDCYNVVSITNGSDRKTAKNLKLEDAVEFAKKHAEESEKSYTEKAYDKSLKGFGKKPAKVEEKEEADKMDNVDSETQKDIADDTDVKAEEKADKENAPINKDVSAPMGGTIVDKIEKIIDRILKNKADAKTAHLKTDKDMESSDKLSVKLKDTPALKDKKS